MILTGFFDDSGKESDPANRIICAAGYVANEGIWKGFASLWRHQLLKHKMEWLHMKDFMAKDSKEYASLELGWTKRALIIEDLINTIKISQLIGFGVALDARAWRKIPREITKQNGDAQQFCFLRILRMIINRMKISCPNEQLSICFDCDRGYTSARFNRYILLREKIQDAGRFLVSFTIGEPRYFSPLQAADLLAWETRKELMQQLGGYESRIEFKHMLMALPGFFPQYDSELWSEDELRRELGV